MSRWCYDVVFYLMPDWHSQNIINKHIANHNRQHIFDHHIANHNRQHIFDHRIANCYHPHIISGTTDSVNEIFFRTIGEIEQTV